MFGFEYYIPAATVLAGLIQMLETIDFKERRKEGEKR